MINRSLFNSKLHCIAALLGCFFLYSCENDDKVIKDLTEKKVMVEEAKTVESYLSQNGKLKAKLTAPTMLRVMADTLYVEFPNTLHCDFYNDSMQIETTLDCKYGKYFESYNKVYLRDSVIVVSMKGDTLRCPDLWWDQSKGLFYTDKYTRYTNKTDTYYGSKGMEATQDLKRITFNEGGGNVLMPENGFPRN